MRPSKPTTPTDVEESRKMILGHVIIAGRACGYPITAEIVEEIDAVDYGLRWSRWGKSYALEQYLPEKGWVRVPVLFIKPPPKNLVD